MYVERADPSSIRPKETSSFMYFRARLKFRVDHLRHLEAYVCFGCTAPSSAQKHGQGETEPVPVHLQNYGHRRAQVRRRSWGAKLAMPAWLAHRFTVYQTTLAVTPASCRFPPFKTRLNTLPSLTP